VQKTVSFSVHWTMPICRITYVQSVRYICRIVYGVLYSVLFTESCIEHCSSVPAGPAVPGHCLSQNIPAEKGTRRRAQGSFCRQVRTYGLVWQVSGGEHSHHSRDRWVVN
jgi:hypothetical protein